MTNDNNDKKSKFNLEERTAIFGENAIKFCKKIPRSTITNPLIIQLIKCTTSVGANYCEADDAESREDFKHKIGICKKECRESKHFLRMIVIIINEQADIKEEAKRLWNEAKELHLIFNTIYKKVKTNNKKFSDS